MNLKSLYFSIVLLLSLPFAQAESFQGGTLRMCVGGFCSDQTTQSPMAGTGQSGYDNARYQAYRYELNQNYHKEVKKLQSQVESWAQEKAETEKLTVAEFNAELQKALEKLNTTLPQIPGDLPTLVERRQKNPLPTRKEDREFVEQELNKIWREVESNSPQKVADRIAESFGELMPKQVLPDIINQHRKAKAQFIRNELIMSQVINGDGLILAPYVDPTGVALRSNPLTDAGFKTRQLMNQNIANRSVIRAKCFAGKAEAKDCAVAEEYNSLMQMSLLVTDRWALKFRPGRVEESEAFQQHFDKMKVLVALGEGFVSGATGAIDAMKEMVLHPIQTTNALVSAVYNYDKTFKALQDAVVETWDDYQSGDATDRARILGQVGFEVLSAFVPVSKLGVVQKIASGSKSAAQAISGIGRHVLEAGKRGVITTVDQAYALTQVLKNTLNKFPNEAIKDFTLSAQDYFVSWRKSYKHIDTKSAEHYNDISISHGYEPSWKVGTKVFEFKLTQQEVFYRVHLKGKPWGAWLLHKHDIDGLSPIEIKEKFALPKKPEMLSQVEVPEGTSLLKGRVGKNKFGGDNEGAVQYQLLQEIDSDNFKPIGPLED